jgi:hypothetical protein
MTFLITEPSATPTMNVEEFCIALHNLNLSQTKQGLAILWFLDAEQPGASRTSGELAKLFRESGLGDPHSTRLGEGIRNSGHATLTSQRLRLKPTSREVIGKWVSSAFGKPLPAVNQTAGFLPKAIWEGTRRRYVDSIAGQINGCYEFELYDGASVLVRRLIESLLIECYEHLEIEQQIKGPDGNYRMLSDIISAATDKAQLPLGRETKANLRAIKEAGDRAAHSRHYLACKADLDKVQSGARAAVQELIHVAGLK